jgi:acyl-CoA thioester hydrolase
MAPRRRRKSYFKRVAGAPDPLMAQIQRRVKFSEVDAMGIVWYGRYPGYFEEGADLLGRQYGLSYKDFYEANLRAPIAQLHIDYYQPLMLDEEFTIKASFVWDEAARINTEYALLKQDGSIAVMGYTVQVFTDGVTGEVYFAPPELFERCRNKWKAGEFKCLKKKL